MLGEQEFQDMSEVAIFNVIGHYAETKGYEAVYFKVNTPTFNVENCSLELDGKYMHYIHLIKEDEMKFSIYYDEFEIGSMFMGAPYYELYDRCDIERFMESDEEEINLYDRVKEIL